MSWNTPDFSSERGIFQQFKSELIAGVDEVGRGALAGPLVAAAVVFENYDSIESDLAGVKDSKKLTAKKRQELSGLIKTKATDFAYGEVSVEEIDQLGVGMANIVAFKRAVDGLKKCDFVLIDGRKFRGFEYPYRCFTKGESKSLSIAAASIIAKVFRDDLMHKLHLELPDFGFYSNKGYGSSNHIEALKKLGPSIHHRKSFLKFLDKEATLF